MRMKKKMADKQQIIINGGDVNECDFFIKNRDKYLCRCAKINSFGDIVTPKNAENSNCLDNYNCYYKQLARKTQECELLETQLESYHIGEPKLRQRIQELEEECEQIKEKYEALKLENQEGYEIVAELKQECEELKERKLKLELNENHNKNEIKKLKKRIRKDREFFKNKISSLTLARKEFSEALDHFNWQIGLVKNDRYRKALEEIEKILKDEICEECPGKEGCKAGCKEHQCLDIISRAKGKE